MILRFAGSAAEIFAKFREIEQRCAVVEQDPSATEHRAPPARETRPCPSSDPYQDLLLRWPSATPPES
jgi:hypothetical protein